jgi:hypothetical protein
MNNDNYKITEDELRGFARKLKRAQTIALWTGYTMMTVVLGVMWGLALSGSPYLGLAGLFLWLLVGLWLTSPVRKPGR